MRITARRREIFLRTLAETGSSVAAAQAATPWSTHRLGGLSTFRDEADRDPEFRVAWDQAEAAALAKVETEIMRRAMTPTRRPLFSKGELKGFVEEYDNRLLVTLAKRLNPEAWSERQTIEHTGAVAHLHGHVVATLEPRDVLLLDPAEREQLLSLVGKIAIAKGQVYEQQPERLPAGSAT